jgi:hypothetical protein
LQLVGKRFKDEETLAAAGLVSDIVQGKGADITPRL